MTIIIVIILIMEMQPAVTAPAVWYLQTCLGLSWCSLLPVKRHPFTPMSIEEAAQASTLTGSSDAPIETEETAEETAEVKSFEVAAAETSEMRNQPYNAADWMQPAAARWLLAPSSKLARWESCDLLLTRFVQRKYENSRRLYEKTSLLIFLNIKLNVECCKKFISFPVPCFGDLLQTPFVIATPRLYFHIGPRCWSIATTIAVGATVLGRDSHPGYKLLASAVPWQNSTPRLVASWSSRVSKFLFCAWFTLEVPCKGDSELGNSSVSCSQPLVFRKCVIWCNMSFRPSLLDRIEMLRWTPLSSGTIGFTCLVPSRCTRFDPFGWGG